MSGNNHDGVANFYCVRTAWNNDSSVAVDESDKYIVLKFKNREWHANSSRFLVDIELDSLYLLIKEMVKSEDIIAVARSTLSTYICDN